MHRSLPFLLALIPALAAAAPSTLSHQGRLLDSTGAPLDGNDSVTFTLYDAASGGNTVHTETQSVPFDNGFYSVILGDSTALDTTKIDDNTLYLGIAVSGGAELSPRLQLGVVPHAIVAESVIGGTVDASSVAIDGTTVIDTNGSFVGDVDWAQLQNVPTSADSDTLADLSGCTTGNIAVYSGTEWTCESTETVTVLAENIIGDTISIDRLPVGYGSDELKPGDAPDADTLGALSCEDGESVSYNDSDSAWECTPASSGGGTTLVLQLEFEETNAPFADTSGVGNDALLPAGGATGGSGGHASTTAVGFLGGALEIAAGNTIPNSPQVWTEVWAYPTNISGSDRTIVEKDTQWRISLADGVPVFTVNAMGGSCTVSHVSNIAVNSWTHLAGSYDGLTISVSANGKVTSAVCTNGAIKPADATALYIGASRQGGNAANPFEGRLDEVRVRTVAPAYQPTKCPAGWVDLGPKCAKPVIQDAETFGRAVLACYAENARLCDSQDHLFLCSSRGDLGIDYPNDTWMFTGERSWEQYADGRVYPTHHSVRLAGGTCFDSTTSPSPPDQHVTWHHGSTQLNSWCCSTPRN